MNIIRKNYLQRNLIIFIVFTLIYLKSILGISRGESVFGLASVADFLLSYFPIIFLIIFTLYSIIKIKPWSDKLLGSTLILISIISFFQMGTSFNKILLVFNFSYLLFAFYFFINWEVEINKACYNPKFSLNDLDKKYYYKGTGKLISLSSGSSEVAHITNLDDSSCFLSFENEVIINANEVYRYCISLEGIEFIQELVPVVCLDDMKSAGFVFNDKKVKEINNTQLNLSDLEHVYQGQGLFN